MTFIKPKNISELLSVLKNRSKKFYLLAGGTDINVQIKNGMITNEDIIFINHLENLKKIEEKDNFIKIGALVTFDNLINSTVLQYRIPFLVNSLKNFASPLLQTMATIGGNIGNGSPTADILPLLLVFDTKLELMNADDTRTIDLKDYFSGYKRTVKKIDEIISNILIPISNLNYDREYYRKVGARNALTIAKISIAGLLNQKDDVITKIRLAAGSLNEYARRLPEMENYLQNRNINLINWEEVEKILSEEITPISDIRSDKEYRFRVFLNLLKSFLGNESL